MGCCLDQLAAIRVRSRQCMDSRLTKMDFFITLGHIYPFDRVLREQFGVADAVAHEGIKMTVGSNAIRH